MGPAECHPGLPAVHRPSVRLRLEPHGRYPRRNRPCHAAWRPRSHELLSRWTTAKAMTTTPTISKQTTNPASPEPEPGPAEKYVYSFGEGRADRWVEGLARLTSNPRFAWDCYRRFIQMFGSVVMGLEKPEFEERIQALKKKRRVKLDTDLTAADLQALVRDFDALVRKRSGRAFPQDPTQQLTLARDAVFRSWMNDRAIYYRKQNHIPDDLGTAVSVQAMVFGNMGETSATGVGFTRNPATGENQFYGEFLTNAQGEDVVAGVRTPRPIADLAKEMPEAYRELHEITRRLEQHYRDVQDFEFTIQAGSLFLLQTRTGQRTGTAAVRIAVDMANEGLITREEAILRVTPAHVDQCLHPRLDPKAKLDVIARGLAASPGAAVGAAGVLRRPPPPS